MKKTVTLLALATVALCGYESLEESVKDSSITLDARLFYFDRDFKDPATTPNAKSLTLGGIAKVETAPWYNLQVAVAPYGNFLTGITDRDDAAGTSMLEQTRDGVQTNKNLLFIGEGYAKYSVGKSSLQIGRQRLSTPLANDHDLRALPSTYTAAVLRTNEIKDTLVEIGYIKSYTGFGSRYNTFSDEASKWGKDGLAYLYLQNSSIANTKINAQYIKALDNNAITVSDYRYFDASYNLTSNSSIEVQYGGNKYRVADNSHMIGARVKYNIWNVDTALLYNKIMDNNFKAVESGPMYSDWQQGYGPYQPSQAFGGYIVLKPMDNASIKLGAVKVSAKEERVTDDFSEYNADINYAFNKQNKLRVRYSLKDESDEANALNKEDRTDFRVIYYYSFSNK
jgi:hypothetical protein